MEHTVPEPRTDRSARPARTLARRAAALALVLAIIPIGWAGVVWLFPLWTILMSVLLFRRPEVVAPVAAQPM